MAIPRTAMIDDDGSGTTGTILNNAWKQELYNQIDANPAAIAFTPTWASTGTAPTLGNGSVTGRYAQLGKLVVMTFEFIYGSTSAPGSGVFVFSLPPVVVSPFVFVLTAEVFNSAVGSYSGIATAFGATQFAIYTAGAPNGVGPTVPFTFKANDRLKASGTILLS